ncbi:SpaA isopeptide-forming pilin-related protein [Propionimicrobium lymphophilum]|uniref:SpaA isopeptide-forming pilin-related protein n=1 Tax=Propionimicrobium lymphophilum TaxID=33012 RepID=UPI003EC66ED1
MKGATFGLYSPDKADALPEADVKALGDDVPATTEYNGTAYYLFKTAVSDKDGAVSFDGLNKDKYFVAELKAPDGYNATWSGWEFTKPAAGQQPDATTVKNYGGYILPKSGGIGTAILTVVGLLLAGSSALAIVYRGRYRRDY